jgi:hypothetical protein
MKKVLLLILLVFVFAGFTYSQNYKFECKNLGTVQDVQHGKEIVGACWFQYLINIPNYDFMAFPLEEEEEQFYYNFAINNVTATTREKLKRIYDVYHIRIVYGTHVVTLFAYTYPDGVELAGNLEVLDRRRNN